MTSNWELFRIDTLQLPIFVYEIAAQIGAFSDNVVFIFVKS